MGGRSISASLTVRMSQAGMILGALWELPTAGDMQVECSPQWRQETGQTGGREGCGCDQRPLKSAQHHCNRPDPRPRWDAVTCLCSMSLFPQAAGGAPFIAELWRMGNATTAMGPPIQKPHAVAPVCSWAVKMGCGEHGGRDARSGCMPWHCTKDNVSV